MIGKLHIDGKDAFIEYGIFVHDSGYSALVQWPALKSIDSNDWPEEDGIDPDLSDPKLNTKDFTIKFCCVDNEKTVKLFQNLTDGAYHAFMFDEIGIEKELRLVSQPDISTIVPLQIFSLRLADDFPLKGYQYMEPVSIPDCYQQGFEIDGVDLSSYGVWITEGTLNRILKAPDVKQNLIVNTENIEGAIYENTNVRFKSKDVVFKCFLKAPSIEIFWRNYNAFLYDITRPTERMLYIIDSEEYFSFYYKSSQVRKFAILYDGSVWCEFDITLCFISPRPGQVEYLLTTEDGRLIITEESTDNYSVFIDMSGYEN